MEWRHLGGPVDAWSATEAAGVGVVVDACVGREIYGDGGGWYAVIVDHLYNEAECRYGIPTAPLARKSNMETLDEAKSWAEREVSEIKKASLR